MCGSFTVLIAVITRTSLDRGNWLNHRSRPLHDRSSVTASARDSRVRVALLRGCALSGRVMIEIGIGNGPHQPKTHAVISDEA